MDVSAVHLLHLLFYFGFIDVWTCVGHFQSHVACQDLPWRSSTGPDLVGVVAPASGLTHMDRAEGRSKLAELKNGFGPFTVAEAT